MRFVISVLPASVYSVLIRGTRADAASLPAMATLNLSANGPSISKSYQSVVNSPPPSGPAVKSPTYGQWAVFSVAAPLVSAFQQESGKESVLKVQSTGGGRSQEHKLTDIG